MRPTRDTLPGAGGQERRVLSGCPGVAGSVSRTVVGLRRGVAHARPCRRPGCLWGPQTG